MMTVFIGGSRAVSRLNAKLREKLDDLMKRDCKILVGDANGADKAVQRHLAIRRYENVVIFCMDRCRNNVGDWQTRTIASKSGKKGFAYYATKDLAMAREAKCGVMLWDGKSKGTLNNIINLMKEGKKVLVYFAPDKTFYKLSNEGDLWTLLERCDKWQRARLTKFMDEIHYEVQMGNQTSFFS